jgi:citrate lyase beta subunit
VTPAERLAAELLMADLEDAVRLGEDEPALIAASGGGEGDITVPGKQS